MLNLRLIGLLAKKEKITRTRVISVCDRMLIETLFPSGDPNRASELSDELMTVLHQDMKDTLSLILPR
jgi:hypothetical protein